MKIQHKERPILFSGTMVRAIREGRKTQTRRAVKPQPAFEFHGVPFQKAHELGEQPLPIRCFYGKPGDRLWVKETHWRQKWLGQCSRVRYRADDMMRIGPNQFSPAMAKEPKWMPSIFMPRWASRITLEIVSVRVERLNAIDADDAESEGCGCGVNDETGGPVARYKTLWESINGPGSWDMNPWVWVLEFKEVKP